jgi:hypothetical protein
MTTYKLTKTETNVKAAKYLYQVIDENGNVLSTRQSNRDYVAATIKGHYFFGRLDLIGKGDHGRNVKEVKQYLPTLTDSSLIDYHKNLLNSLELIAYL